MFLVLQGKKGLLSCKPPFSTAVPLCIYQHLFRMITVTVTRVFSLSLSLVTVTVPCIPLFTHWFSGRRGRARGVEGHGCNGER